MGIKYLHLPKGGVEYGDTASTLANKPITSSDIRRFAIERVRRNEGTDDRPFCEDGQTRTQSTA